MQSLNAIEIRGLVKSFKGMNALDGLNMTVPAQSIYGFIGENGSGKSTTEKLICGLLVPNNGTIKLFGKDYTDASIRSKVGALIENAGCFPNSSIYMNLKMQALNLNLTNIDEEIDRVLKIVRMEDSKYIKFKSCSLGMKQRVGIAMALLGSPVILILDEPINGLDVDGMRIMREILVDITKNYGCTVVISSHILGELEKIATHYGIIRQGKMIEEISAEEMEKRSRVLITIKTTNNEETLKVLKQKYSKVLYDKEYIKLYDVEETEEVVEYLITNKQMINEIKRNKVGLEEYYIELMTKKEVQ